MCDRRVMNRRRNALADIFADLSREKIEQLQRFVNTDSGFEDESPAAELIDDALTVDPTSDPISSPLNRCTDQSNPIDIHRHNSPNDAFHDQVNAKCLVFRDFDSNNVDSIASDDDEEGDERFVQFFNSPRYHQRRLGIAENTFRENLNMLTGILASH